ncbi:hypothetical protein [Streptomyces sp. NPDC058045]|uniref:baeRF2 domain-containing protein n=1 Tax=Streptomyces sp. NPDC058045 TaxID=3346311 RepID=UPI0036EFC697
MDLGFLHPLYERPGPWASVYADTSQHDAAAPHERARAARDVLRRLADQGADQATCEALRSALEELRHSPEPFGRALFAAGGRVVLDPPLAAPPRGTRAGWAALPHTTPLLELAGEDPLCLVAYVDPQGAVLELRGSSGREDPAAVTTWPEHHLRLRAEDGPERHAVETAGALAARHEETRADLVVLAGPDRERRAVYERLPQQLRELTVEAEQTMGDRLLPDELAQLREEQVRRHAADDLELFLSARSPGPGGRRRAVEGVPALLAAARAHRIAELLVRPSGPDGHREVWVGDEPDQVTLPGPVGRPSSPVPRAARADDALLRCAAMSGAPALSVTSVGPDDAPAGGLGAVLRWS